MLSTLTCCSGLQVTNRARSKGTLPVSRTHELSVSFVPGPIWRCYFGWHWDCAWLYSSNHMMLVVIVSFPSHRKGDIMAVSSHHAVCAQTTHGIGDKLKQSWTAIVRCVQVLKAIACV